MTARALSNLLGLFLVVTIPFGLTSCGDAHDKAARDMISLFNRMADVLETIKDADSAKAAQAKLKPLIEEMKALKAHTDTLGEPANDKALQEKYGKEFEAVQKRLMAALMKAMSSGPEAAAALQELGEAMRGLK